MTQRCRPAAAFHAQRRPGVRRAYIGYLKAMADNSWTVQIGEIDDPGNTGVPPVPTEVYQGDEEGARAEYAERSGEAREKGYRYVMLRHTGAVVECWGTPPAAG